MHIEPFIRTSARYLTRRDPDTIGRVLTAGSFAAAMLALVAVCWAATI